MQPRTVVIPAGEFEMGESDADKFANDTERPRHRVGIMRPFRMGAFPVTVAEYRAFVPDHAPTDAPDLPAVNVSWIDARNFCRWLTETADGSWRLPSESEWEYACRAGSQTPFSSGIEIALAHANFLYDEQGGRVGRGTRTPAGAFPPNAFGLESMHGNVCEWCEDSWLPDYAGAPIDESPRRGEGGLRVIRGGAWDYLPRLLRSSWRDRLPEATRRDNVGFRVACDLP